MLVELFSWWTGQMRDLAAPLLRRASGDTRDALVLESIADTGGPWRLVRRRNGALTQVALIAAGAGDAVWRQAFASRRRREPVVVALNQPALLRRTTVPAAAAANLDRLLGYEMDRLTPFGAGEVVFSHSIRSRDLASGTLEVEIAVVPKAWLREPLERLAAILVRPAALEIRADAPGPEGNRAGGRPGAAQSRSDHAIRHISLDHDPSGITRVRRIQRALAGICLALAVAVVAVPFARQAADLAAADEQISLLRPRMAEVDALRRRIASSSAGAGRIVAAREHGLAALQALGVLTELLPDDTYLTSLSLRHDRLTIEGRSAAATKLIASLAADPNLRNPSFAAPVVRAEDGTDIFTIQAGFGS